MNQNLIILPTFALFLLTAVVLVKMFLTRVNCIKKGEIDPRYFKMYSGDVDLPKKAVYTTRNFTNLFEAPTLFYVLSAFILITQKLDMILLALAWVYVALRVLHTVIHITKNKIMPRLVLYGVSWVVLLIMWILFLVKLV